MSLKVKTTMHVGKSVIKQSGTSLLANRGSTQPRKFAAKSVPGLRTDNTI